MALDWHNADIIFLKISRSRNEKFLMIRKFVISQWFDEKVGYLFFGRVQFWYNYFLLIDWIIWRIETFRVVQHSLDAPKYQRVSDLFLMPLICTHCNIAAAIATALIFANNVRITSEFILKYQIILDNLWENNYIWQKINQI